MTLDEAIKHAEEVVESKEYQVKNGAWEKDSFTEKKCIECAEEHRQLAGWLKELKQLRKQTRWIPVSERLPGKNGEYLITGRKGAVNKRRYHDGHWCGNWSVLAWMPLPQPYKEGSEEI